MKDILICLGIFGSLFLMTSFIASIFLFFHFLHEMTKGRSTTWVIWVVLIIPIYLAYFYIGWMALVLAFLICLSFSLPAYEETEEDSS